MERFGWLEAIMTSYPRFHLRSEGIAAEKIIANPWFHLPLIAKWRMGWHHPNFDREWSKFMDRRQQAFIVRNLPACDVFIALSGSGLQGGRLARQRGGVWICDRSSAHLGYTDDLLADEFSRFDVPYRRTDPWQLEKELREYAEADVVVVPSEFARQSFLAKGVDASRLARISFGSDLKQFRRIAEPEPGAFVVCYVGQVGFRKGIPYLLEAFRRVRHPRKRLVIAGDVKAEIKNYLASAPLEGVEFLGHLPRAQLPEIYSRANVFAMASLEEGMAVVQTEAMACGLPVVATFNAGATDVIEEGLNGFVVPVREPDVMAARLQLLADDSILCREMGLNARASIERLGGWDSYGDRFRELCLQLVG
jgi:glycosyltransferase involved in cell wall biosynthesis